MVESKLMEVNTYQEKVRGVIQSSFPKADICSILKFSGGLTSSVYKVGIHNPDKILAVKFFPKKLESKVEKSIQISNYLREHNLPAPQSYGLIKGDTEGSVVMDCLSGQVASEIWETASIENQQIILTNSGTVLKKIHDLKIPSFWNHQKHEVASAKEWVDWTSLRIEKYLIAAEENLDEEAVDFLKKAFKRLQNLYELHQDFRFVPLHWDYHLWNINVDENFNISGLFDFDNAMKGHDMADLGQTVYWLIIQQKLLRKELFKSFFTGYGTLSALDREFIYLHFLLFLGGVMRSICPKDNLRWLNKIHIEVLKECIQGEYLFIKINSS